MMNGLNALLQETGSRSIDLIWFPLLLWSVCAAIVYLLLKLFKKSDVLYQYHTRVALVAGIPLGILVTLAAPFFNGLFSNPVSSEKLSFFVVQNPIAVTAEAGTQQVASWSDPHFWIGAVTLLLLFTGFIRIALLIRNYRKILAFKYCLAPDAVHKTDLSSSDGTKIFVAFSDELDVPCTFGWRRPVIVIPSFLKNNPEKTDMSIRHELVHIRNGDYLVNAFVLFIKNMFWFHPLLHLFDWEIREFREICCDSEVVSDRSVSPKKYAQLLMELAPARKTTGLTVLNMSVNKSTLKRRIEAMSKINSGRSLLKSSMIYLVLLGGLTGFIACSDLQTDGLTESDVAQFQSDMTQAPAEGQPLYVLFEDTDLDGERDGEGEIWPTEQGNILARVKPAYIRSITVLKDRSAVDLYGERGRYGAILIIFVDREQALSDLNEEPPPPPQPSAETSTRQTDQAGRQVPPPPPEQVYLVAQEMPSLIGGYESIANNLGYPEDARRAGIEGTVTVQFVVDEEGEVENPTILRGVTASLDEEALRIVRESRFEPGLQDGRPVKVRMSIPVVFRL